MADRSSLGVHLKRLFNRRAGIAGPWLAIPPG
jgi:hypothetical protein